MNARALRLFFTFALCLIAQLSMGQEINKRRWSVTVGALGVNPYAAGRAGQFSAFRPPLSEEGSESGSILSGEFLSKLYDPSSININAGVPLFAEISYQLDQKERNIFGVRAGWSSLQSYGSQAIDPVNFNSLEGRLETNWLKKSFGSLYSLLGLGLASLEEESSSQLLFGAGINLKFSPVWSLRVASDYHVALNQAFFDYFAHSIGVSYKLKGADRDKDGVWDAYDSCPDTPGKREFLGCPDSDNDGTEDRFDRCPTLPGPVALGGCPDSDKDGISDPFDQCPDTYGDPDFGGCPDRDGDTLIDSLDNCPDQFGPKRTGGCPIIDRDGDTIADNEDQCPNTAGSVANNGCPDSELPEEIDINELAKSLGFARGGFTFITASREVLGKIIQFMHDHPLQKYDLVGFTDSVGPDDVNLELSKNRAKRLHDYLISRGIDPDRLSFEGRGELPEDPALIGVEPHPHRRVEIRIRE
ncbi:MAG: OmpA family protein [Bacteroidetes bacterium]|nr:OmpA family protein [Bacteroidota bacterium]